MRTIRKRSEVPLQYTWNLESIFPNNADWEQRFHELEQQLPAIEKLKGTLHQSVEVFLVVLHTRARLFEVAERLLIYAYMRRDEDTSLNIYQDMTERATRLQIHLATLFSFIEPEIVVLPQTLLEHLLQHPDLQQQYEYWLCNLQRQQTHLRTSEIEAILTSAEELASTPRTTFLMLETDRRFPTIRNEQDEHVVLTPNTSFAFLRSRVRRVRQEAFEGFFGTLATQHHSRAAALAAQIKAEIFYARQRSYQSCREMTLSQENIPEHIYDQLIETVNDHLPLFHRYLQLRKRLLHLDELRMYDLDVPLIEEQAAVINYEEACETIVAALASLGDTYVQDLKQALGQRWVDVYETIGKQVYGAYTGGSYGTQPFVLLNFQDDRPSMYILIHELGHAMHSYYTWMHQPHHYSDYPIFIAEVASVLNEHELTDHLLATASTPRTRLAILDQSLNLFRTTFFQRALVAEFELVVHQYAEQGDSLTANMLDSFYRRLLEKYYAPEVVIDDLSALEWARMRQFYNKPFYIYQYATSFAAATTLVEQMRAEGEPAVERYLAFLRAGASDDSVVLLKRAGVDMTSPEPITRTLQRFRSYLEQMEQLTTEI